MTTTAQQGKIFLADQRGCTENLKIRRFSTLNFADYFNEHKTAIDNLYLFNDDFLAGEKKTCIEIDRNSYIVILPITGKVNYLDDSENETDINVEEAIIVYVEKGTNITLSNPYKSDVINYLCIGLVAGEPMPNNPRFYNLDLNSQNKLYKINNDELPFNLLIGRFEGRKEAIYQNTTLCNLFAFVINGAFEVEGRLLHEKDALNLRDSKQMELEALSNNAIVLIITLK